MKANELKHRIKIYKKEQSKNEFLENDFTAVLFKEVFASCKEISSETKELNKGSSLFSIYEFELRFLELKDDCFIVFRNEKYEIIGLEDESQNRQFLKIKARKIK